MTKQELFEYFNTTNSIENLANIVQTYFIDNSLDYSIITPEYIKTIIDKVKTSNIKYQNNISTNSIFAYIEENIDLTDPIMTDSESISLIDEIINSNENYWKNSLNSLIKIWNKRISNQDQHSLNDLTNNKPEEITEVSALVSFSSSDWVQPEIKNGLNFQNQIGAQINNSNAKLGLQNSHHYQETNQSYLNLIMPKNSRRVEAADLNRNFWVIDSNISYLLKYLFDDTSPVTIMNTGIIKEISELWENMLYLWAAIYVIYGIKYHPLHLEIMYLPNDNNFPDRKFDNFATSTFDYYNTTSQNLIKERFEFLKHKYPYHNLCIIPIIREDNYTHNYYSKERYPCLIMKKHGTSELQLIQLYSSSSNFTPGVCVDEDDHTNLIFLNGVGFTDVNINNYNSYYIYPYSFIDSFKELEQHDYLSAFRMVPYIDYTYDKGVLTIKTLKFTYIDVIALSINEINRYIRIGTGEYGYYKNVSNLVYNFYDNTQNPTDFKITFTTTIIGKELSLGNEPDTKIDSTVKRRKGVITNQYYLGECISNIQTSDLADFNLETESVSLLPAYGAGLVLVDDENKNTYMAGALSTIIASRQTVWNNLTKDDTNIIELFSKKYSAYDEESSSDVSMVLYVGEHLMGYYGDSEQTTYWGLLGTNNIIQRKKQVLDKHAYHLFNGAVIYNPISESTQQYPLYSFYSYFTPDCAWVYYTKDSEKDGSSSTDYGWTGGTDNYAYYYYLTNDGKINNNNWAIRYIQTAYCLSYDQSQLGLPSEFNQNKWNENAWDSHNPHPRTVTWDVYGIPDEYLTELQSKATVKQRERDNLIANYKQSIKNYLQYGLTWINEINRVGMGQYLTTVWNDKLESYIYIPTENAYTDAKTETNYILYTRYLCGNNYINLEKPASFPDLVTVSYYYYVWAALGEYDKIVAAKNNYNNWYNNEKQKYVNQYEQHFTGSQTIQMYPVYSKIKTHLFFADGRYAAREYIQTGDTRTKWTYRVEDTENYESLRQLLPDCPWTTSIEPTYTKNGSDAKRNRTIDNTIRQITLDYEKYPVNGHSNVSTTIIT